MLAVEGEERVSVRLGGQELERGAGVQVVESHGSSALALALLQQRPRERVRVGTGNRMQPLRHVAGFLWRDAGALQPPAGQGSRDVQAARTGPAGRSERPAILARLEAEGRLRPAKNPGYVPQRLHPVSDADPNPLTRALLEDRESER